MTETATERPPARSRHIVRDMALSLIVLLIPVALVVFAFRARGGEDVVIVDPGPAIAEARAANAFPVAVPTDLASGWRSVSAVFGSGPAGATLRIGYLTPDGDGLQLIEASVPADALLVRELGDRVRPVGVVAAAGIDWSSFEVRDGERAIVRKDTGRTMVVIGQADFSELQELAAALGR